MNERPYAPLGNIINLRRGHDLTRDDMQAGSTPVVGSNGIIGYHNSHTTNAPCLTIGRSGSVGAVTYIEADCWAHNTTLYVDDFKGNNPKFVYYLLKNLDLVYLHSGSVVPSLNRNYLHPLKVPYTNDIKEQEAISAVLSVVDAKIEINNRINSALEDMVKTLYDYWFVQFDFPDKNGKPYKSSGGKMVWNVELKREIPEGWENGTLGDIAELVRGVTYGAMDIKSENDIGVIPVLRATNITGNFIDLNEMVYVPKQNVSTEQILNKFDIVITMSSGSKEHIGKNGFFYYDKEVTFGAFCGKIVAKDEYRFYLYSFTQSNFMFTTIRNECLGTNINNLNGSLVRGFKIVIPPKELIKSFNEKVNFVYEKVGCNLKENQELTELRDWLLPMLMNGQVKVN
jgi:type I restriction enzyme S subunit